MRAGRGKRAVFHHPGGVDGAGVLHAMVGMVHEPVGSAVRRGPGGRLLQRLQRQLFGVHAGGARPADDAAGERVGDERRVAEASVRHAHVGDVGDMQPVRCRRLELWRVSRSFCHGSIISHRVRGNTEQNQSISRRVAFFFDMIYVSQKINV